MNSKQWVLVKDSEGESIVTSIDNTVVEVYKGIPGWTVIPVLVMTQEEFDEAISIARSEGAEDVS